MPAWFDDSLDSKLTFDASPSFDGGQFSSSRVNLLEPNQYASGQNLARNLSGELITRRGTAALGSFQSPNFGGLYYYKNTTIEYLVQYRNTHLYYFDGVAWQQLGTYTGTLGAQMHFAQGINKLYWSDGVGGIYSWDGTTQVSLAAAPVAPRSMVWHTNRLIVGGKPSAPDTLYFSDVLDGATWPAPNSFEVGGGEGDPIIALVSWTDHNLIVFKQNSIWVVNCDPLQIVAAGTVSDFSVKRITDKTGCIASRTAVHVGNDVYFLSPTGVRSIQRTVATENQAELGTPISEPIRDILDRITTAYKQLSCAYFWNDRYFLSLPVDGATLPNTVIPYHTLLRSWDGEWDWVAVDFAVMRQLSPDRLVMHKSTGVLEWLDYVAEGAEITSTFQDDGQDIAWEFISRGHTYQEPLSPKTGFNCEFEFNKSSAEVRAYVRRDDRSDEHLDIFQTASGGITLPQTLPFTLPEQGIRRLPFDLQQYGPFREIQFRLKGVGKVRLRAIALSGWLDTMIAQDIAAA